MTIAEGLQSPVTDVEAKDRKGCEFQPADSQGLASLGCRAIQQFHRTFIHPAAEPAIQSLAEGTAADRRGEVEERHRGVKLQVVRRAEDLVGGEALCRYHRSCDELKARSKNRMSQISTRLIEQCNAIVLRDRPRPRSCGNMNHIQ
jgi:DNA-binding GntR family transcriptional regulator